MLEHHGLFRNAGRRSCFPQRRVGNSAGPLSSVIVARSLIWTRCAQARCAWARRAWARCLGRDALGASQAARMDWWGARTLWLRRRPAKPMRSPCVGSDPTGVVCALSFEFLFEDVVPCPWTPCPHAALDTLRLDAMPWPRSWASCPWPLSSPPPPPPRPPCPWPPQTPQGKNKGVLGCLGRGRGRGPEGISSAGS